jgi:hypothetical protein
VRGELEASLSIETVPVTAVVPAGANVTWSVTDWLGVNTVLAVSPVSVKPVPVIETLEIVTFELPVLVRVAFKRPLLPIFTVPKLRLTGFDARSLVAVAAVPLKGIVSGDPGALLVSKIEPFRGPEPVGANVAEKVVLLPAAIDAGTVRPVMENPVPETVA